MLWEKYDCSKQSPHWDQLRCWYPGEEKKCSLYTRPYIFLQCDLVQAHTIMYSTPVEERVKPMIINIVIFIHSPAFHCPGDAVKHDVSLLSTQYAITVSFTLHKESLIQSVTLRLSVNCSHYSIIWADNRFRTARIRNPPVIIARDKLHPKSARLTFSMDNPSLTCCFRGILCILESISLHTNWSSIRWISLHLWN